MNDRPSPEMFIQRIRQWSSILAERVDADEVEELRRQIHVAGLSTQETILGLGVLLVERSVKAGREYLRQAPLLVDRLQANEWGPWVGVGLTMAGRSAVAAVRYFRESPLILAEADQRAIRIAMFTAANRLAEREPGLAMEYFRHAPSIARLFSSASPESIDEALRQWVACGEALASQDSILASEYFKQSPSLLVHLPIASLPDWAAMGGSLVQPNQLGKPDYLPALEYFRLTPEWLGALSPQELRPIVIALGRALSDLLPDDRVRLFKRVHGWLRDWPALWRLWVVERSRDLAERSPHAAIAFLECSGEVARRLQRRFSSGADVFRAADEGAWREPLESWFRHGLSLFGRSPEGAMAYFRMESSSSQTYLDGAVGALSLLQVARTLALFAEMLCGESVSIQPLSEQPPPGDGEDSLPSVLPYREGRVIYLPPFVGAFGSSEENFLYYRMMTAYQAAQLEWATFQLTSDELAALGGLAAWGTNRMTSQSSREQADGLPVVLQRFFDQFPQPDVVKDLWKIAEGGRIDANLRQAYPGLRADLDLVVGYTLFRRPTIMKIGEGGGAAPSSRLEKVMEILLQLSMAGRTKEPIPVGLEEVVEAACSRFQPAQRPGATAADSLRAACETYALLRERLSGAMDQREAGRPMMTEGSGDPDGSPGEESVGQRQGSYRELIMPEYRGQSREEAWTVTGAARVDEREQPEDEADRPPAALDHAAAEGGQSQHSQSHVEEYQDSGLTDSEQTRESHQPLAGSFEVAQTGVAPPSLPAVEKGDAHRSLPTTFTYAEWDEAAQDYRPGWCTVREVACGSGDAAAHPDDSFVDRVRSDYHGQLVLLRRAFERLRPDRLAWMKRRESGEEIDLEAAVEARLDRRAGLTPSSKLYRQRERRDRDVAVMLLVDVSGSTGRQLLAGGEHAVTSGAPHRSHRGGQTVVQVEQEGLYLLAEAISSVGDALAIYAYSGDSRDRVELYIIKTFDEQYTRQTGERIGAMSSLVQNRDGAAIRHATRKLVEQAAKTRLLMLLSDGRPFDREYEAGYALADTRMALQEALRQRVQPFCITIDRHGDDYLRQLYPPSRYIIIDDIRQLPERLPWLYRRVTTS